MNPRSKRRPTGGSRSPIRPKRPEVVAESKSNDDVGASTAEVKGEKLHKMLAQAGLGSRRAMEERIRAGEVTVNGKLATVGDRVTVDDKVRVVERLVAWPQADQLPRVVLYHKPEGEIVSNSDPQGRPTVFDHLPRTRGGKWLAIGRLDFNTSGLLIFTTSGDLANRMMHPRFEVEREYAVRVLGAVSAPTLATLCSGVELEDGRANFEYVEEEGGEGANRWFRVLLKEGRNRVVRRLFESQGLTVSRLMRVRFGILGLPPRLKRGQFMELVGADVETLMSWTSEPAAHTQLMLPSVIEERSHPRRSFAPK